MTLVQTITVGPSGASSIQFTGIPQTGTDLLLLVSDKTNNTADAAGLYLTFNGGLGGNDTILYGDYGNVRASSNGLGFAGYFQMSTGANVFGNKSIYVTNYAGSQQKMFSSEAVNELNTGFNIRMSISGTISPVTAAITSMLLSPGSGVNFVEHTTASLYIITKA
jgi:hypothetical protein